MVGTAADIAPSAYLFRGDRRPHQNPPEADFLFRAIGHPRTSVLCGLLWEEPRLVERVELSWPSGSVPSPGDVVVRWFAHGTSSSWWSRLGVNGAAPTVETATVSEVSADARTFLYRVDALSPQTSTDNIVAVLVRPTETTGCYPPPLYASPKIRAITTETWRCSEIEIEWGFQPGTEGLPFDGEVEAYNGAIGPVSPLKGDASTTLTGERCWTSAGDSRGRSGIRFEVLHLGRSSNTASWTRQARLEHGNRTIITVRTCSGSFSFLPADLQSGPILAPEYGFFARAAKPAPAPAKVNDRDELQDLTGGNLLPKYEEAIEGTPGLAGWTGDGTSWIAANTGGDEIALFTFTIPVGALAMHPSPERPVALGWRSPIRGAVNVSVRAFNAYPATRNGFNWLVILQRAGAAKILRSGIVEKGGHSSVDTSLTDPVSVEPGDLLSLVISPRGLYEPCDPAVVEFVIEEADGGGRAWNATRELAGDIGASNPHADGSGELEVWYFYSPPEEDPGELEVPVYPTRAENAREVAEELAASGLKTVRQRVREHAEQSWEGAMRALHPGEELPEYPEPEMEPPATVDIPDRRLRDAWRSGAWHLLRVLPRDSQGRIVMMCHPYVALAQESFLIIHALDVAGMHREAGEGLARWLEKDPSVPVKLDGLFADTVGVMSGAEWDWQHMGGPGLMQGEMMEHFALTGNTAWLRAAAPMLRANAEWMVRQRRTYALDLPVRERLWARGFLPPHNAGDSTNWRSWYASNANYWLGLRRYAEGIAELDPAAAAKFLAEAEEYARDIRAAIDTSLALSPVVRVRDGTYRSFLPAAPYIRGPSSRSLPKASCDPGHTPGLYADVVTGGLHCLHPSGLLPKEDSRAQGMMDVMEDRLLLEHHRLRVRTPGYDPDTQWFDHAGWYYQCGIERTADIHLLWDDIPSFLRSLYNQCAVNIVVGSYTHQEHTTRAPDDKSFEEASFLVRLRNMLVMEEGDRLWLARGTPRAWLRQGETIAASQMPTHFGPVDYRVTSDTDHGAISAKVTVPRRRMPAEILLRLRHPTAARLRQVSVGGARWDDFDPDLEVIRLCGLTGTVSVEARYAEGR